MAVTQFLEMPFSTDAFKVAITSAGFSALTTAVPATIIFAPA